MSSVILALSPPSSPSSIAILTAESVLDSPSLDAMSAAECLSSHHARSAADHEEQPQVSGLKSLVSRAKERSKRRESFGPVDRRGAGALESVLEDSETEEDGLKEGIQAPASTPSRPRIFRRNSPTKVVPRFASFKSTRVGSAERRLSLPLTPSESPADIFAFGVPTSRANTARSVPSAFPPSFSSSSDDSDSNSSSDEACTTPTSCSSFGYQQQTQALSPSKHLGSAAYFDHPKQKMVLPGSQNVARASVVAPSVGSGLAAGATKPRLSLPLPKNDYALKAGRKQQIDLILPSLAAGKLGRPSPTPVARRVSAPLPTLSQISARLQPIRRSTAPDAVPTLKTVADLESGGGGAGSRLPPFLLARRLREEAAKAEAQRSNEELTIEEPSVKRMMTCPIPTFTVTPPPERAEEGRKVRELLVGRLSVRPC